MPTASLWCFPAPQRGSQVDGAVAEAAGSTEVFTLWPFTEQAPAWWHWHTCSAWDTPGKVSLILQCSQQWVWLSHKTSPSSSSSGCTLVAILLFTVNLISYRTPGEDEQWFILCPLETLTLHLGTFSSFCPQSMNSKPSGGFIPTPRRHKVLGYEM